MDAFIAEQDDLQGAVDRLEEDKAALNDVIARLKRDSPPVAGARVADLKEQNRQLEREIQLLVGEKAQLATTRDAQMREGEAKVEALEDELARKEEEIGRVGDELRGEGKKATLLRSRLTQVEKQRGELVERNGELVAALSDLKDKVEALVKEREELSREREELQVDNERMFAELEKGDEAAATCHNLQTKLVAATEGGEKLEEELKERDVRLLALEGELEERDDLEGELKERDARLAKLEGALEEADARQTKLQEDLAERDAQHMEDGRTITRLVDDQQAAQETTTADRTTIAAMHERQLELEEELAARKSAIARLEFALQESQESSGRRAGSPPSLGVSDLDARRGGGMDSIGEESLEEMEDLMATNAALRGQVEDLKIRLAAVPHEDEVSGPHGHTPAIARLEDAKAGLEADMEEAGNTITMLEDELDQKDARFQELLAKLTSCQQQFSQADKARDTLAEETTRLGREQDDLRTQIKMLTIQKNVALEEVESLKAMKTIADEEDKEETQQAMQELRDRFEENREQHSQQVAQMQRKMLYLEQSKRSVEEDLEEGNDAIAMLREALKELEDGKVRREATIKELRAKLVAAEVQKGFREKLQEEHQVSVNAVSALQKTNTSLQHAKEHLEEMLNASSTELRKLQDQKEKENAAHEAAQEEIHQEARRLDNELATAHEENHVLSERIDELVEVNEMMKGQVKDLGKNLAKVSLRHAALQGPPPTNEMRALVASSDPVTSCNGLLADLREQVERIVVARNAALDEIRELRGAVGGGGTLMPSGGGGSNLCTDQSERLTPPARAAAGEGRISNEEAQAAAQVAAVSDALAMVEKSAPLSTTTSLPTVNDLRASRPEEDEARSTTTGLTGLSSLRTMGPIPSKTSDKSVHTTGTRGSALLEAAKKICNQLDEKRSRDGPEKPGSGNVGSAAMSVTTKKSAVPVPVPKGDRSAKALAVPIDIDDNISAKEVKKESTKEIPYEVKNKLHFNNSKQEGDTKEDLAPRTQPRYDIDELTSIYFEKCGMSVSRFSDLSSDSSSFFRRRAKLAKSKADDGTVTKKVKICRNGVFMGTFEGDLNDEGQRHGFGVLLCDNGNSYEGEWKKDKRDGLGIARYSSGDVYDGQWQRGKRHGHGVMYIEAGDTYIGSWRHGLKHGAGTYHWADGEVDVSLYQEDRRIGEGVRWNTSRSHAHRLIRGAKKEELSLDEAHATAEKLGLNLEKFDVGVP